MSNGSSSSSGGGAGRPQRSEGGARGGGGGYQQRPKRRFQHRKKICRFCVNGELKIDYKDAKALRPFLSERGKIVPRRMSGACAKHQRVISTAIKRARVLAIVPFAATVLE